LLPQLALARSGNPLLSDICRDRFYEENPPVKPASFPPFSLSSLLKLELADSFGRSQGIHDFENVGQLFHLT
ncbi:MAG: hypothetical protein KAX26_15115, partial [Anaerolineae bacterium]|nr:hypothetical protein [Anaerolineae bacterium]